MGTWGQGHSTGGEVFLSDLEIRALKLFFTKTNISIFKKSHSGLG